MLFKGFGLGLFVVLAAVLMLGTVAVDSEFFWNQHYDYPKSDFGNNYCNEMMNWRNLTSQECKKVNTFIHDPKEKIIDVCGKGGERIGDKLWRSDRLFQVTNCWRKGQRKTPPCDYREEIRAGQIEIACENGEPEHFVKTHYRRYTN